MAGRSAGVPPEAKQHEAPGEGKEHYPHERGTSSTRAYNSSARSEQSFSNSSDPGTSVTFDGMPAALAERSLACLKPMARNLCCVLAKEDLNSEALMGMGFNSVLGGTAPAMQEVDRVASAACQDLVAFLVISHGTDVDSVTEIVQALNKNADAPPIVVALLLPANDQVPDVDPDKAHEAELALGRSLEGARVALYEAGADDTLCLYNGEPLRCYRLLEMLHKSELMAKRMGDIIEAEVEAAEQKAASKMQSAYQKFLLMMPGTVLEAIPPEDPTLEELKDEKGVLCGIGTIDFIEKLGSGSFGHVFKAEHSTLGPVAVKVITKSKATKNAASLFSLDREICMLMHLDPHPNVVRAHIALHSKHYFCVVMDHAGPWNLQAYIKDYLGSSNDAALPEAMVKKFLGQQAIALGHLHHAMVCHRDLKPDNWIVNDAGDMLRLTDMGLAMQVVGTGQALRQSCGSLPFCAPEVLSSEESGSHGYDPFAADIWSLGVNWLELLQGPFSIERLLGWLPKHPSKRDKLIEGLASLPGLWAEVMAEIKDELGLGTIIAKMVIMRPTLRWRIGQVLGSQGLNLVNEARPPRSPLAGRKHQKTPPAGVSVGAH